MFSRSTLFSTAITLVVVLGYVPSASARFYTDFIVDDDVTSSVLVAGDIPIDTLTFGDDFQVSEATNDGQFLTRSQFTEELMRSAFPGIRKDRCFAALNPKGFTKLYRDVLVNDAASGEICMAMLEGLVDGYRDGSFKPDSPIAFSEVATTISRLYVLAPYANTESDIGPWYGAHVNALGLRNAIPLSITTLNSRVTAADVGEIITRIEKNITWKESRSYTELVEKTFPKPIVTVVPRKVQGISPSQSSSAKSTSSSQASSSSRKGWGWW